MSNYFTSCFSLQAKCGSTHGTETMTGLSLVTKSLHHTHSHTLTHTDTHTLTHTHTHRNLSEMNMHHHTYMTHFISHTHTSTSYFTNTRSEEHTSTLHSH